MNFKKKIATNGSTIQLDYLNFTTDRQKKNSFSAESSVRPAEWEAGEQIQDGTQTAHVRRLDRGGDLEAFAGATGQIPAQAEAEYLDVLAAGGAACCEKVVRLEFTVRKDA